jgi:hypothetical protein
MAHYAKIEDDIVTKVIVAETEFFNDFVDSSPGEWVQTSYNTRGGVHYQPDSDNPSDDQSKALHKNFAGVGYHYDGTGFYAPKPYNSWTLNTTSYLWEAPVAYPDSGFHVWNETDQRWDEVT